jgi:outer membrane protein assembly factor BamB
VARGFGACAIALALAAPVGAATHKIVHHKATAGKPAAKASAKHGKRAQKKARKVAAPAAPPAPPPPVPGDPNALGGYNLLVADRGNNRLVLLSPDKKIVWEYDFQGLKPGDGADDAFFSEDGKTVIVNLEHGHVIQLIDFATKTVKWDYGHLGQPGGKDGYLNYPDDAYLLANGDVVVADIRNCRVIEIAPDKHIVHQAGKTGVCGTQWPYLGSPNGDKPLPNGHYLVSTINDHSIHELDENWQQIFSLQFPIQYPSDPQPTKAGNFIVADYTHNGSVIEIQRDGKVVWDYRAKDDGGLRLPSLAFELPNGNIAINDDFNHRVMVVDKASQKILWQYGVTGQPGKADGYLSIPDGMDVIKAQ